MSRGSLLGCAAAAAADAEVRRLVETVDGGDVLMERAAKAACDWLLSGPLASVCRSGRIVLLAGPGDNGGDALALARLLSGCGMAVFVWFVPGRNGGLSAACQRQMTRAVSADVAVRRWDGTAATDAAADMASAKVVVDGLAGTGLQGPLAGPVAALAACAASVRSPRVALDLPSGLSDAWEPGFLCLPAAWTLCFGRPKLALYRPAARQLCGQIVVCGIGFPERLEADDGAPVLLEEDDALAAVPALPSHAHKGTRGRLDLFAGSERYPGAAWLAAEAARRSRTGIVTLYGDSACLQVWRGRAGGLIVRDAAELFAEGSDRGAVVAGADAVAVGPGWGQAPGRAVALATLASRCRDAGLPLVLDADAIRLLAANPSLVLPAETVLTPHPGEAAALAGCSVAEVLAAPESLACVLARRHGAVVTLKGAVTIIAAPDGRVAVYDGSNPALAQAGSGDLLAGVCGAVAASLAAASSSQPGELAWTAACAAVAALGRAGRAAAAERGWFVVEDLLPYLAAVWPDRPAVRQTVFFGGV